MDGCTFFQWAEISKPFMLSSIHPTDKTSFILASSVKDKDEIQKIYLIHYI